MSDFDLFGYVYVDDQIRFKTEDFNSKIKKKGKSNFIDAWNT